VIPHKSMLNVQKRGLPGRSVKADRRVRRTRDRLGQALRKLMEERPLEKISVQDVIELAGVSRSAFYAHYDDKVDLLLSDMDEFLERMATLLVVRNEQSDRIAPVSEFFSHVGEAVEIRGALARSERLQDFFDLAVEHFGRGIEARLKQIKWQSASDRQSGSDLTAHALAGAFIGLLNSWTRTGQRQSPESMDSLFHQMVWGGLAGRTENNNGRWKAESLKR
jgi:AcrR family transcriptional regulator